MEAKAKSRKAAEATIGVSSAAAGEAAVQVGHVERAGGAVEQADARQEGDGGDQVEADVLGRAVELVLAAADDEQAEGGDQHHLEPDVHVEDVAGQEGAADAGEHGVGQGVVAEVLLLGGDVGEGEDQDGEGDERGQEDHDGRQAGRRRA